LQLLKSLSLLVLVFAAAGGGCAVAPERTSTAGMVVGTSVGAGWTAVAHDPGGGRGSWSARRPVVILWADGFCVRLSFGPFSRGVNAGATPESAAIASELGRSGVLTRAMGAAEWHTGSMAADSLTVFDTRSARSHGWDGWLVSLDHDGSHAAGEPGGPTWNAWRGVAGPSERAEDFAQMWSLLERSLAMAAMSLPASRPDDSAIGEARRRLSALPKSEGLLGLFDTVRQRGDASPGPLPDVLAYTRIDRISGEPERTAILWPDGMLYRVESADGRQREFVGQLGAEASRRVFARAGRSAVLDPGQTVMGFDDRRESALVLRSAHGVRWAVWDEHLASVNTRGLSVSTPVWASEWELVVDWLVQAPASELNADGFDAVSLETQTAVLDRVRQLGGGRPEELFDSLRNTPR
jgi:hypothetical protein